MNQTKVESRKQAIRDRLVPIIGEVESPLFRQLLQAFIQGARSQRERLRGGLSAGLAAEVRQAAHALVGMSLNLALSELAQISREVETAAEGGASPAAGTLARLDAEMTHVEAVVAALMA